MHSRKVASLAAALSGIGILSLATWGLGAPPPAKLASPPLRILSDRELPLRLQPAADVRWAGEGSAYFALARSGTVEAALEPLGGNIKEVIPGASKPDGFWGSSRIGVSSEYLVVAGPAFSLTWRKLATPLRKEIPFDVIEDVDVGGKRLAVLAARRDDQGRFAPEGAIAWVGSLDKDLTDLRPILYDQRGEGAPSLNACGNFEIGAVRYLSNGELLIVPGVQAGAALYDAQGRLIRTWDTVGLGLDNDCSALSQEQAAQLRHPAPRVAWLNQRRTLEDVVALPQGPGLLVRSVSGGRPVWTLKVLDRNGSGATTYAIPVSPVSELSHLRADARNGKLLLLMSTLDKTFINREKGRLIIAELPERR